MSVALLGLLLEKIVSMHPRRDHWDFNVVCYMKIDWDDSSIWPSPSMPSLPPRHEKSIYLRSLEGKPWLLLWFCVGRLLVRFKVSPTWRKLPLVLRHRLSHAVSFLLADHYYTVDMIDTLKPAYLSLILGLVLSEEISLSWLNASMWVRGSPIP